MKVGLNIGGERSGKLIEQSMNNEVLFANIYRDFHLICLTPVRCTSFKIQEEKLCMDKYHWVIYAQYDTPRVEEDEVTIFGANLI